MKGLSHCLCVDVCQYTALMEAATNGHGDVCLTLIEKGADIHAKNDGGVSSSVLCMCVCMYIRMHVCIYVYVS